MTDLAWGITIGYAILTILGVSAALIVFRSTRVGFRIKVADRETLEKRETYWGLAVVTFLVVVLGGTIFQLPYWTDDSNEKTPQSIEVTGRQFAWTIDPPRVKVGLKTRIELHSVDVSHAMGLYDPDGVLVKQVNVLPGVTQKVVVTFDDVGVYKLRCLEFCGVDHHLMENDLEVTQ